MDIKVENTKPPSLIKIEPEVDPEISAANNRQAKAKAEMEALKVEMNLEAVRKGYTDYEAARVQFDIDKKELDDKMAKFPDLELANQASKELKEQAVKERKEATDFARSVKSQGDKYLADKKLDGNAYIRQAEETVKQKREEDTALLFNIEKAVVYFDENIKPTRLIIVNILKALNAYNAGNTTLPLLYKYLEHQHNSLAIFANAVVPDTESIILDNRGNNPFWVADAMFSLFKKDSGSHRGEIKIDCHTIQDEMNRQHPEEAGKIILRMEPLPERISRSTVEPTFTN